MTNTHSFDVIIIGGSYSGLSAALSLGRSLRQVLIIDSGKPCNEQTPHSHNFLTHDGETPRSIASKAKEEVSKYETVQFYSGLAIHGEKTDSGFEITTETGEIFRTKKLIFATGVRDIMPEMEGISECWGISVIHCPYCHGYEVRGEKTGLLANGEIAYEFSKMVHHLTKDLTIFTNGKSTMTEEQSDQLKNKGIVIVETEIASLKHTQGQIEAVIFKDGTSLNLKALYAKLPFEQHSDIPEKMGCDFSPSGHIQVDVFQKTSIPGVFACGDNTTQMRSVSNAVAAGTFAGAMTNKELIDESF
ncbi:Alkyl hydroperoxide reductase subunit F [compost metagenome]